MKHTEAGFTLIELMVVVIIIAALATMVLPKVILAPNAAKSKIVRGDMAGIKTALSMYYLHNDRYPTSDEGLSILMQISTSKTWKGAYLESAPIDPWKRDYRYVYPGNKNTSGFDLWSVGPDGENGTDDDIANWGE